MSNKSVEHEHAETPVKPKKRNSTKKEKVGDKKKPEMKKTKKENNKELKSSKPSEETQTESNKTNEKVDINEEAKEESSKTNEKVDINEETKEESSKTNEKGKDINEETKAESSKTNEKGKDINEESKAESSKTKTKLFVATPCYNGMVNVKYMQSVMNLQLVLLNNDIEFQYYTIPFDSLIPRARNACITRFMSTDCTHLIFIDSDIEFSPIDVVKMINMDKDVLGGCYSKKAIDFSSIHKNFDKVENTMELVQSAGKYTFNFKPTESHKIENGCIEVLDAPIGFLLIKRNVITKMIEAYPEREYINDVAPYNIKDDDKFYDFFPSSTYKEEDGINRYLSEDYGFCRLWQNIKGEIYIDLTISLNHIGQFIYCGNPMTFLRYNENVSLK